MESDSTGQDQSRRTGCRPVHGLFHRAGTPGMALLLAVFFLRALSAQATHIESSRPGPALPEAPPPQVSETSKPKAVGPCDLFRAGAAMAVSAAQSAQAASGAVNPAISANSQPDLQPPPCPTLLPLINWYARFLTGPEVKALTPAEKARLAARNVLDPFNLITILGTSAISVGSDAHSPYGPGMRGFGRYVGVSFTQDITGEFFGTFLIPSVVHQDPHYHRMPNDSIPRRVGHAIAQVVWTQGDNGHGMVNYANLAGYAIDDEIGNLYVPGRATNLASSATRYGIGMATAPIDNLVSEFLPDLARHIHVQIVVIQRIINQVAKTDSPGTQ